MLLKGKFRVDFTISELCPTKPIRISEDFVLSYRTEEPFIHKGSTCHKDAFEQIKNIFGPYFDIKIKYIFFLKKYE